MVIELNSPILVHFSSLIPKMLMFTLAISFDHVQFTLIQGPNIPGSCAVLFSTASDFTFIDISTTGCPFHFGSTSSFFLKFCLRFPSSILGTYRPGDFILQCPMFLPFHSVHGILKAKIQEWFAIPFYGPHFVRTLHHDPTLCLLSC